jgi:hypothetical protein
MSAPAVERPDTDTPERPPGPAQVLAALAQFSTPGTLAMIDREVDDAYRQGVAQGDMEPLRRVLERWWHVVRVQRGEIRPPMTDGPGMLRAELARRGLAG